MNEADIIENRLALSLYCCGCGKRVLPRLTNGRETYPHRSDLFMRPFWKCDACQNFVGCHYKTKHRTNPLGCIPTKEIKNARRHLHRLIDPVWQRRNFTFPQETLVLNPFLTILNRLLEHDLEPNFRLWNTANSNAFEVFFVVLSTCYLNGKTDITFLIGNPIG